MATGAQLVTEIVGGEPYEYYPMGEYIVRAPGICGGRPTFRYTRLDVSHVVRQVARGRSLDEVAIAYSLSREAVSEAILLAAEAVRQQTA
jgi:uncharacterized protein (DUF433 family)